MTERSAEAILDDLGRILRDFHGREYFGAIRRDTRFFADLGLASIDAVVLGETLESLYGRRLPFGELMADLGQRTDRDLTLGELTDFLQKRLSEDPPCRVP